MATIIENQRRAFITAAQDDARRLASSLANLSDAQRAAIYAVSIANTSTPLDAVYICDEGDLDLICQILDGVLTRGPEAYSWHLGSGCFFTAVPAPGTEERR